jgi:hypothetical protein
MYHSSNMNHCVFVCKVRHINISHFACTLIGYVYFSLEKWEWIESDEFWIFLSYLGSLGLKTSLEAIFEFNSYFLEKENEGQRY